MAVRSTSGEGDPPPGTHDAPDGYAHLVRIDQGGFAIVYRALDTRFDRTVALKILRSDSLNQRQIRRFNAECMATGRVSSHPNIVTVYDAGTTPGNRPWLAMEYCSGGSLAHKVTTQGPMPVAEVISIGARLCSALSAAHGAGILHRDVKPHNVLLTSYGEPALADFGIASVVIDDDTGSIATETAAYTVVHAAPEILEGKAGTAASDIYSLGSTLYTLLAGRAPYAKEASTGLAPLVARILRNDVPAIDRPGVPPELERLLRRSMAADPHDRPDSAAELGASLAELGPRQAAEENVSQPGPIARSVVAPAAETIAPPTKEPSDGEIDEQALQVTNRRNFRRSEPHPCPPAPAAVTPTPQPAAVTPGPAAVTPGPAAVTRPPSVVEAAPAPVAPVSARRLLVLLAGMLGGLLVAFTVWGLTHIPAQAEPRSPLAPAAKSTPSASMHVPRNVAVTQGRAKGELIVTWRMPVRPATVATVIYEGAGATKARTIVNYDTDPEAVPRATLGGLPSGRRVCLSAAHLVSIEDKVTNAVSGPICAVPR